MTPHARHTSAQRALGACLFALASAAMLFLAVPAAADPDNHGTVKVHNPNETGDESNEPHVGCAFYVEGFNLDSASGTIVVEQWSPSPSGHGAVVLSTTYSGHDFDNGPYSLPAGHYKLFVSNSNHDKMKVFWVDCGATTTTSPGTSATNGTTSTTNDTTSTTAQIPFFPSALAAGLGSVGALGGAVFVLRRRL